MQTQVGNAFQALAQAAFDVHQQLKSRKIIIYLADLTLSPRELFKIAMDVKYI